MAKKLILVLIIILLFPFSIEALPIVKGSSITNWGMSTTAGSGTSRGGDQTKIIKVTNLNNSGSGSFREAVTDTEPRTIVFEVSGTIELTSMLQLQNDYCTIAGQTAPSPGITISGRIQGSGDNELFGVRADHVLIQHLRFRKGRAGGDGSSTDSFGVYQTNSNVVVDHCSISWATDESFGIAGGTPSDIIVQNCLIAESCDEPTAGDNYSMLVGPGSDKVLVYRCLLGQNRARHPNIGGDNVAMINNVVWNWQNVATSIEEGDNPQFVNWIGNVYKWGAESHNKEPLWIRTNANSPDVFASDNMLNGSVPTPWHATMVDDDKGATQAGSIISAAMPSGLTASSSSVVEASVLTSVGARPIDRDSVDARLISEYQADPQVSTMIVDESDVGGFPSLAENTRTLTLPDGKTDDTLSSDTVEASGYTTTEEWLHTFYDAVGTATAVSTNPVIEGSVTGGIR